MARLKGKSGPPGNMSAFKYGLASIQKRREEGVPTQHEENVRQQILEGLIAARVASYLPNERRLILDRLSQSSRRIERIDTSDKFHKICLLEFNSVN